MQRYARTYQPVRPARSSTPPKRGTSMAPVDTSKFAEYTVDAPNLSVATSSMTIQRRADTHSGAPNAGRAPSGLNTQTLIGLQQSHGNTFVRHFLQTQISAKTVGQSGPPSPAPSKATATSAANSTTSDGSQKMAPATAALPTTSPGGVAPTDTRKPSAIGAQSAAKTGATATQTATVETEASSTKVPPKPAQETDARFQGVMKRLKRTASQAKSHEPAGKKAADARAASVPPENDRRSRAQADQVEVMDQQEAKKPPTQDFLTMLRAEIARIAPKNMEETEKFKEDGKAAELKGTLTTQVGQRKDAATKGIKGATQTEPDPKSVPPKEVAPLPPEPTEAPPPNLGAADVLPPPKTDSEVSLEGNKKKANELMAENDIDEDQLKKANEPKFTAALEAKGELEAHADKAPQTYRQEEQAYLQDEKSKLAANEKDGKRDLNTKRARAKGAVLSRQDEAKKKEEEERKKVADKIEGIYQQTRKKVEEKLSSLDKDVTNIFDSGEKAARDRFESYVDRKMSEYKYDRYIDRIGGSVLWAKDKLFGMPDEVNRFYEDGRDQYLKDMDAVLVRISETVESRLKEAKTEIANGKKEIRQYIESLPKDLQKAGEEAEKNISTKFDELEEGVEAKKQELAENLARRYQESRDKLDERIKELQAENQGLVDAFIAKIKEIIEILRNFKEKIGALLKKAGDVLRLIIKDPIGFLGNLLDAVKLGFNQFMGNILTHLKAGLAGWLFGTLASAGIELPTEFSVKAVFGLVLQVLGITKDRLRAKVVKLIGAKNVERIEKAWSWIMKLISVGPAGLWEEVKEYIGNLKETIISSVQEWVITQIIKQAVLWVISLFNPVSALIKAIQAIYGVIMFFIERIDQIIQLVEAVVESVAKIVAGNITEAANWIEKAMGRTVPLIISFLANLLGLGGISEKIKSIISKVQKTVDKAIDKVLAKIASKVKAIFGRVKAGAAKVKEKGKQVIERFLEWWKIRKKFKSPDGKPHTVYFEGKSASADLMVATSPIKVKNFLQDKRTETAALKDSTVKKQQLSVIGEAETLNGQVAKTQKALAKANADSKTSKQKKPVEANKALYDQLEGEIAQLVDKLKLIRASDKTDFPPMIIPGFSDNVKAQSFKAQYLRKKGLPKGTAASSHKGHLGGWSTLVAAKFTEGSKWVKMHLLTERLGGKATDSNLTPARGPETNTKFYGDMESYAISAIENDPDKMIWYQVNISYHSPPHDAYPSSVDATWGEYKLQGSTWKEEPADKHAFKQNPAAPDFTGGSEEKVNFNEDGRVKIESIVKSESFARIILEERENGRFKNYNDLYKRIQQREQGKSGPPIAGLTAMLNKIFIAVSNDKATFG